MTQQIGISLYPSLYYHYTHSASQPAQWALGGPAGARRLRSPCLYLCKLRERRPPRCGGFDVVERRTLRFTACDAPPSPPLPSQERRRRRCQRERRRPAASATPTCLVKRRAPDGGHAGSRPRAHRERRPHARRRPRARGRARSLLMRASSAARPVARRIRTGR